MSTNFMFIVFWVNSYARVFLVYEEKRDKLASNLDQTRHFEQQTFCKLFVNSLPQKDDGDLYAFVNLSAHTF